MPRHLLLLVMTLTFAATAFAQPMAMPPSVYPADLVPTHANLPYAQASPAQVLDLFLPRGEGPFPLVVNIHGGGFMLGSKEMLPAPVARMLLENNIAVATLNYRLSDEAPFPAAVQDCKAAVRYLRANAKGFDLKPEGIVAFGQSAGGNLASMLGVTGNTTGFDAPELGNATVSSAVQGVIDWFGPTDFIRMNVQAGQQGCGKEFRTHGRAGSPEARYLGGPILEHPALLRFTNPITYTSASAPPFLLQKGTEDCVVPVGQTKIFHEALLAAGVEVELTLLEGAGHGDLGSPVPHFMSEENLERMLQFVRRAADD